MEKEKNTSIAQYLYMSQSEGKLHGVYAKEKRLISKLIKYFSETYSFEPDAMLLGSSWYAYRGFLKEALIWESLFVLGSFAIFNVKMLVGYIFIFAVIQGFIAIPMLNKYITKKIDVPVLMTEEVKGEEIVSKVEEHIHHSKKWFIRSIVLRILTYICFWDIINLFHAYISIWRY